jgi:long-chain acyl-CoA synthetase
VAACAVVAIETASGTEPCAVLAMRGSPDQAAAAIEGANARLAEFQRLRRWVLWPEPDLPRTSTGKVRRKAVAAWLAELQVASTTSEAATARAGAFGASADWLLALIAQISGETPSGVGDELRLTEDLLLDSLGRVQLAAALEARLGIAPESGLLEKARTLGELRALLAGEAEGTRAEAEEGRVARRTPHEQTEGAQRTVEMPNPEGDGGFNPRVEPPGSSRALAPEEGLSGIRPESGPFPAAYKGQVDTEPEPARYIYPRWPWLAPFRWLRAAFTEAVAQPLVWLLANPKVVAPELAAPDEPMLIVANHVTAYDGPLVQYALPGRMRRRIAAAMAGDMLEDYRHFRNPERPPGKKGFYPPGPVIWLLLTALFNVFPLPRRRNFQRSFAHAGAAMDRGFNVLVFPEGTRSAEGALARFRGGIGLLVKESGAAVLPVALHGLGELKAAGRGWFRSGKIEVHVGQPIRFAPEETEAAITARLHDAVERLLEG